MSPDWVQQAPATSPPNTYAGSFGYDQARSQFVLFGGGGPTYPNPTPYTTTWVYASGTWTKKSPTTSPPGAIDTPMAFDDSSRQQLVLYTEGDLWAWSGSNWSQLTPSGSAPPARLRASLAYDPTRGGLVLFGGKSDITPGSTVYNDTWLFKGNTWTKLQSAGATGAPPRRAYSQMAYDDATQQMVLFGGSPSATCEPGASGCTGVKDFDDTWVLNSASAVAGGSPLWTQMSPPDPKPGPRYAHAMTYDPDLRAVVVFGGGWDEAYGTWGDTWAWNGTAWLQASSPTWLKDANRPAPSWRLETHLAADGSGKLVLFGGFALTVGGSAGPARDTWILNSRIPVLTAEVYPSSGTRYAGESATVDVLVTNAGSVGITATQVLASLQDSQLVATGSRVLTQTANTTSLPSRPLATGNSCSGGITCVADDTGFRASNVAIPVDKTVIFQFRVTIGTSIAGCHELTFPVSAVSAAGSSTITSPPIDVCGGGLGAEDWWSYDDTDVAPQSTASVNVANGNLLVSATDSTPVQAHGQLAQVLRRHYNSQDSLTSSVASNPLGAGWNLSLGSTTDSLLGVVGLAVPPLQDGLNPLSVVYVDRDGTRHVFKLRSAGVSVGALQLGPIDLTHLLASASTTLRQLLNPLTFPWQKSVQNSYDLVCIDATYSPPPGLDMYLWRYVGVLASQGSTCAQPSGSPVTIGWTAIRPDRVRYDFSATGQILDTVDAAGNEIVYGYSGSEARSRLPGSGKLDPGLTLGALHQAYDATCVPSYPKPTSSACRGYDFDYRTAGSSSLVYLTDPANRVTTYVLAGSPKTLTEVWEPGNSAPYSCSGASCARQPVTTALPSAAYTYATSTSPCPGSVSGTGRAGLLCSATDPSGATIAFGYTSPPSSAFASGPPRVLSVTGPRALANATDGWQKVFTYDDTNDLVTVDVASRTTQGSATPPTGCAGNAACHRTTYRDIDAAGRVGEIDEGSADDRYARQTGYFWDGDDIPACRQPDMVVDNNLCETIVRANPTNAPFTPTGVGTAQLNGVTVADQATRYTYGDLGQLITEDRIIDPAQSWTTANSAITTHSWHGQYLLANLDTDGVAENRARAYDDLVTGNGKVASDSGATTTYRAAVLGEPSLAAYWRLAESGTSSTTMLDQTGNDDGTYNPGALLAQPGAIGANRAIGIPGSQYAATVPPMANFPTSSAFSTEEWVKTTATGDAYDLALTAGDRGLIIGRRAGAPWVQLIGSIAGGNAIEIVGQSQINNGAWHHVVVTYDGSGHAAGVKIYVDGAPVANGTPVSDDLNGLSFVPSGATLQIGNRLGQSGQDGTTLDEVALYNAALTSGDVSDHYGAVANRARVDADTLYAITDQTQVLPPRGNAPSATWGDYVTTYRRDVPDVDAKSYPRPNDTLGSSVCASNSPVGNTGLLCETDTPAAAGVNAGDCTAPTRGPGYNTATSPNYAYTCETRSYNDDGLLVSTRSPKAHADSDPATTTYTYYGDPATNDGANACTNDPKNCDLTGSVSTGGWLKAVTDVAGHSVVYAYDAAGNVIRSWDRNATNGQSLSANWADPANPPANAYAETLLGNPVTPDSIGVGFGDSIAVDGDGTVQVSGLNANGQLGNNTTTASAAPVTTQGLAQIVAVATTGNGPTSTSGCFTNYALAGDGNVYAWGSGTNGALGNGATTDATLPVKVSGLPPIIAIAAGGCHALALDHTGAVWAWGSNAAGQLGNTAAATAQTTPIKVSLPSHTAAAAIAAGRNHSLAVLTDGSVLAWGANAEGELGDGTTTSRPTPTPVTGLSGRVLAVSGGAFNSYAIADTGAVYAWGAASNGALGNGNTSTPALSPQTIPALDRAGVKQLVAGEYSAAALLRDGTVRVWGKNNQKQLAGATSSGSSATPLTAPGITNVAALAAGYNTYLAATATGRVTIWGNNLNGQAGTGSKSSSLTPGIAPTTSGYQLAPYANPSPYVRAVRSPTGDITTAVVDKLGDVRISRPARGTTVYTTAYDSTATFDLEQDQLTSLAPQERADNHATTFSYDAFGNRTVTIDPTNKAAVTTYDRVNRAIQTQTTRDAAVTAAGYCTATASGPPFTSDQTGHRICTVSTTYDGNDQVITATDANIHTATSRYDGLGRRIAAITPRNDGTYTNLPAHQLNYDRDGNVVDDCPPRQFDSTHETNTTSTCTSTGVYSAHFAFDSAGNKTTTTVYRVTGATTKPLQTTYRHDADGNLVATTDANGNLGSTDANGNAFTTPPDPATYTTTATYDLQDRRTTLTVPRTATSDNTTRWRYDPAGNVTAVLAPGAGNTGTGATGDLVVDGTTGANSSDGQLHDSTNPFRIPANANYGDVTLQNGAWITGPAGSNGLILTATGTVTICSSCRVTMDGQGGAGAAATTSNTGLDAAGANGGKGGHANTLLAVAAGGGGGGHNGTGQTGSTTNASSAAPGAGGATSGTPDFSDVGADYSRGSGGGGGGGGRIGNTHPGAAGGNGGGFVHVSADTITINGRITANGTDGQPGPASGDAGGGGGAGGGIWLTAGTITLAASDHLTAQGGAGGLGAGNATTRKGGDGANGYLRIDADHPVTNEPGGTTEGLTSNVTAYSYDAANRLVDTLRGAQTLQADPSLDSTASALPDPNGTYNLRTRNVYDPDGRIAAVLPPLAFSDAASLSAPNRAIETRADFDLDGRAVTAYSPRYDSTATSQGTGNDGGSGVDQQTTQCPKNPVTQYVRGAGSYPSDTGVCITRTSYDARDAVTRQDLATETGSSNNRYVKIDYTDDGLTLNTDAPNPAATGGARLVRTAPNQYDGDGRTVKVTDALGNVRTRTFTADGLISATDATGYGTVTHHSTFKYNANGNAIRSVSPRGSGTTDDSYATVSTYTSDGLTTSVSQPGQDATDHRVTKYLYDAVGNPTSVYSPSAVAGDATNPGGRPTVNTFTRDNLIATSSTPITTGSYRTTRYSYTPAGVKSAQRTGLCTSSDPTNCAPGNSAWQDGGTQRLTYAPTGANLTQTGRDSKVITFGYDRGGRLASVADDTSGTTVQATYYLDDLLRTVTDGNNTNTYAYDAAGNPTSRSDNPAGSSPAAVSSVAYNDAGLAATETAPVTSVQYAWTYDKDARPATRTGGPVNRSWTYHEDSTLDTATVSGGSGSDATYSYTYDNDGNIVTQAATGSGIGADAGADSYAYTNGDQLLSFTRASGTTTYAWDHDGNRTRVSDPSGTSTYKYNADDTIDTSTSGGSTATYIYDQAGRLTSDGTTCTTYDGFDRTATVKTYDTTTPTIDCTTLPTPKTTSTYTYDGLDRQRIVDVTGGDHPGTTKYLYDGTSSTVTGLRNLTNPTGANLTYQLGPGGYLGLSLDNGGTTTVSHLADDGEGNTTQVITSGGALACAARFDPFGTPLKPVAGGNGVCNVGSAVDTPNTIWYRSASRDPNTGRYQLGARTYNPGTGTFTTPDSWRAGSPTQDLSVGADPLTSNRYTYANGNPVNLDDPSGHCRADICGAGSPIGGTNGVISENGPVDPGGSPFPDQYPGYYKNGARQPDTGHENDPTGAQPGIIGGASPYIGDELPPMPLDTSTPWDDLLSLGRGVWYAGTHPIQTIKTVVKDTIHNAVGCFSGDSIIRGCLNTAFNFVAVGKGAKVALKLAKDARNARRAEKAARAARDEVGHDGPSVTHDIPPTPRPGSDDVPTRTGSGDRPTADARGNGRGGGHDHSARRSGEHSDGPNPGSTTFHTVQNPVDAARLRGTGEPWPTSPTRAQFGPGVYAWGSRSEAEAYAGALTRHGATDLEIVPFNVSNGDLAGFRSVNVDSLADPDAFMSKYSSLYGEGLAHEYQYITRGTNFGVEHFFDRSVFGQLDFG